MNVAHMGGLWVDAKEGPLQKGGAIQKITHAGGFGCSEGVLGLTLKDQGKRRALD